MYAKSVILCKQVKNEYRQLRGKQHTQYRSQYVFSFEAENYQTSLYFCILFHFNVYFHRMFTFWAS